MSDFLPKNYEAPKSGGSYMKLQQGENRVRVLSAAIVGEEYWTTENKPVRTKTLPQDKPHNIKLRDPSKHWLSGVKHFWAFVVQDKSGGGIKILEITQASIQNTITGLVKDEDWGNPSNYDLVITRTGEGMETRYEVTPKPHSPIDVEVLKEYESMNINLDALYEGGDPFGGSTKKESPTTEHKTEEGEKINVSDLPF